MTIYEMTNTTTVQGNIRISAWVKEEEVIILCEENVDDLQALTCSCYEDCDVTYMFCSRDGFLHIEIDPPEYVSVKREFWADWAGFDPCDDGVSIAFDELPTFAEAHGKTIPELLRECEVYYEVFD